MESRHIVGSFKYFDGKIQDDSVTYNDDESILNWQSDNVFVAPDNLVLKELRWPKYGDKLIHANMILVKRMIADSVNTDTHIIQAINAIEELDKICNTLVKRLREWYSYYYPELSNDIGDNELFVKKVLTESKSTNMVANNILVSMGPDIASNELDVMMGFARQVDDMYLQRQKLMTYIDNTLISYAPNLYSLVGGMIGAKLIEKARSLKHLAYLPSSTVQLLGAEKALFRHLRNKKIRPPKHGLILSHPLVMDSRRSNRGAAARMLAAKISIAVRIDYFKGEFIGDKLREDLEKVLKK